MRDIDAKQYVVGLGAAKFTRDAWAECEATTGALSVATRFRPGICAAAFVRNWLTFEPASATAPMATSAIRVTNSAYSSRSCPSSLRTKYAGGSENPYRPLCVSGTHADTRGATDVPEMPRLCQLSRTVELGRFFRSAGTAVRSRHEYGNCNRHYAKRGPSTTLAAFPLRAHERTFLSSHRQMRGDYPVDANRI